MNFSRISKPIIGKFVSGKNSIISTGGSINNFQNNKLRSANLNVSEISKTIIHNSQNTKSVTFSTSISSNHHKEINRVVRSNVNALVQMPIAICKILPVFLNYIRPRSIQKEMREPRRDTGSFPTLGQWARFLAIPGLMIAGYGCLDHQKKETKQTKL